MGVGTKLEKLIAEKKLNVNVLCKTIGISPSTIYSIIKRDNTKVDLDVLQKIADELGVTLDYFSSGNNRIDAAEPLQMEVSERIKQRRKQLGLSAEQVADIIGVSPATIYRYESKDIANMGIDKITPIAHALNCTPAFLMGWDNSESSSPLQEEHFSLAEQDHIRKYRALDESGKQTVDSVLDIQYERCCAPSDSEEKKLLDAIAATKAIRKKIG